MDPEIPPKKCWKINFLFYHLGYTRGRGGLQLLVALNLSYSDLLSASGNWIDMEVINQSKRVNRDVLSKPAETPCPLWVKSSSRWQHNFIDLTSRLWNTCTTYLGPEFYLRVVIMGKNRKKRDKIWITFWATLSWMSVIFLKCKVIKKFVICRAERFIDFIKT